MTSPSPVSGPQPLTVDERNEYVVIAKRMLYFADQLDDFDPGDAALILRFEDTVVALEAENAARQALRWPEQIFALEVTVSSQQDEIARLRRFAAKAAENFTSMAYAFPTVDPRVKTLRLLASEFKAAATPGEPTHE